MNLFNFGKFKLHSGKTSNFKIDCDALTDEDLDGLAKFVAKRLRENDSHEFSDIVSVPSGGDRFANCLRTHLKINTKYECPILIVDDVYTTGKSMEAAKEKVLANNVDSHIEGIVIFARTTPAPWIMPIFIMDMFNG